MHVICSACNLVTTIGLRRGGRLGRLFCPLCKRPGTLVRAKYNAHTGLWNQPANQPHRKSRPGRRKEVAA